MVLGWFLPPISPPLFVLRFSSLEQDALTFVHHPVGFNTHGQRYPVYCESQPGFALASLLLNMS